MHLFYCQLAPFSHLESGRISFVSLHLASRALFLHPYAWHSVRCYYTLCTVYVIITHSIFVNSSYNWATMAAPVVIKNLQFEDSFKVHNPLHTKFNEKYVFDNILFGIVFVMLGVLGAVPLNALYLSETVPSYLTSATIWCDLFLSLRLWLQDNIDSYCQ